MLVGPLICMFFPISDFGLGRWSDAFRVMQFNNITFGRAAHGHDKAYDYMVFIGMLLMSFANMIS
jgi:hypothetical protein